MPKKTTLKRECDQRGERWIIYYSLLIFSLSLSLQFWLCFVGLVSSISIVPRSVLVCAAGGEELVETLIVVGSLCAAVEADFSIYPAMI